jgi:hypothetical protein
MNVKTFNNYLDYIKSILIIDVTLDDKKISKFDKQV